MNLVETIPLQSALNDSNVSLEEYSRSARNKLNKRLFNKYSSLVGEVYDLSNSEYLSTSLWKTVRGWVRRRDKCTCRTCGIKHPHLDVHHRDYERETLEGYNEKSLITLCRTCHDKIEYFEPQKINKRECELQKEAVLIRMLAEYEAKKIEKMAWKSLTDSFRVQTKFELNINTNRGVTVIELLALIEDFDNVKIDLYTCFCELFDYFEKHSNKTLRTKYHISTDDYFAARSGRKPLNLIDVDSSKNVICFMMKGSNHIVVKATKKYDFNTKELLINFMNEFQYSESFVNIYLSKKNK